VMDPLYENLDLEVQVMQHRAYLAAKSREQQAAAAQSQLQAQARNGGRLQKVGSPAMLNHNGAGSMPSNNGAARGHAAGP
jgi:enhancer of polycomb-like protein